MCAYEIDFLAVGESEKSGDAIVLRFGDLEERPEDQTVIVVDGGFQASGDELVQHIRKYYGRDWVDLVVSTHPDADHINGLEVVLEKLDVVELWLHKPWEHTEDVASMFRDGRVTDKSVSEALRKSLEGARKLERIAHRKSTHIREPFAGIRDSTSRVTVVGPTRAYYRSLLPGFRATPQPRESLSLLERMVRAVKEAPRKFLEKLDIETLPEGGVTSAENNSGAILLMQLDEDYALLTGDAGIEALGRACDYMQNLGIDYRGLRFIQVPHHGSKDNVAPSILDRLIGPRIPTDTNLKTAYVSVSHGAGPKHPSKAVTNAFRRRGAPVYATQGRPLWRSHNAPERPRWSRADPLPFYEEFEE